MKGLFCSECQYGATLSPSSNTKWWPQSGERQISANSCRQIIRFKNISQTTRGRTLSALVLAKAGGQQGPRRLGDRRRAALCYTSDVCFGQSGCRLEKWT